jgi:CheY-like chemotaxis protein
MMAILIVDDNPIQAVTRRMILERSHFHVAIAESGIQALDRMDAGENFGMVITDHLMPEMSGPVLVRHLRQRSADLPILVLSGMAEAEAEYASMDVVFRTKPIPPEELIDLTRTLLFPPLHQTA